jgi:hypothetical protein
MALIELLLNVLVGYLLAGAVFAIAFVRAGVQTVDPADANSSFGFRLLFFPGVTALWPVLLMRWLARVKGRAA